MTRQFTRQWVKVRPGQTWVMTTLLETLYAFVYPKKMELLLEKELFFDATWSQMVGQRMMLRKLISLVQVHRTSQIKLGAKSTQCLAAGI